METAVCAATRLFYTGLERKRREGFSLQALGHSWTVVLSIDDARRELAALGIETREARERASA